MAGDSAEGFEGRGQGCYDSEQRQEVKGFIMCNFLKRMFMFPLDSTLQERVQAREHLASIEARALTLELEADVVSRRKKKSGRSNLNPGSNGSCGTNSGFVGFNGRSNRLSRDQEIQTKRKTRTRS